MLMTSEVPYASSFQFMYGTFPPRLQVRLCRQLVYLNHGSTRIPIPCIIVVKMLILLLRWMMLRVWTWIQQPIRTVVLMTAVKTLSRWPGRQSGNGCSRYVPMLQSRSRWSHKAVLHMPIAIVICKKMCQLLFRFCWVSKNLWRCSCQCARSGLLGPSTLPVPEYCYSAWHPGRQKALACSVHSRHTPCQPFFSLHLFSGTLTGLQLRFTATGLCKKCILQWRRDWGRTFGKRQWPRTAMCLHIHRANSSQSVQS